MMNDELKSILFTSAFSVYPFLSLHLLAFAADSRF
jgi:hypothetical protein